MKNNSSFKKKAIFSAIFLMISCLSCTNNLAEQSSNNMATAEKLFEHFNAHNWSAMADLYLPNCHFTDPTITNGTGLQTKAEIVQKYSDLAQIFPDIKDTIKAMYPSGDSHVIVEFVSTGKAQDGTALNIPICSILAIKDGKIYQDHTYYDNQ